MSYGSRGGHSYGNQRHGSGRRSGKSKAPINVLDYPYSTWAVNKKGKETYGRMFKTKTEAMSEAELLSQQKPDETVTVREFEGGKLKKESVVKQDTFKLAKVNDFIMSKYRWPNEPTYDHLYKVTSVDKDGCYAKLVAVKEDGKWIKRGDAGDHFNWGEARFWDYTFEIGKITPKQGHGKTFKYSGKLPRGLN